MTNKKRTSKIHSERGTQLGNKTPKWRIKAMLGEHRRDVVAPHKTQAMDFAHDQLGTGHKIGVLTVIDSFSSVSPIIDPQFRYWA